MYDYHMHTRVSFDGHDSGLAMALAAKERGLKEICFTDHLDYTPELDMVFDTARYNAEYDALEVPGLLIRRGLEFGLTPENPEQLKKDLGRRHFDFVLGSVHLIDGVDVYFAPYWQEKGYEKGLRLFLERTLECVRVHEDYDVLGHLTYVSKARGNPNHALIRYDDHRAILDEILRELVKHGKGMELNTSGIDRCGGPLPTLDYFQRFHELGGKIVTVGSDAHDVSRAGQYTHEMVAELKKIFGYVCTFADRKPIFHKA
ncbi:MAG: histidinol-phosphatase HisJ family protein [Oscillospiraceae bacterium]|nr:histidinol-phosphatase HisJ family protein [Oscillospiraceae bacterium]